MIPSPFGEFDIPLKSVKYTMQETHMQLFLPGIKVWYLSQICCFFRQDAAWSWEFKLFSSTFSIDQRERIRVITCLLETVWRDLSYFWSWPCTCILNSRQWIDHISKTVPRDCSAIAIGGGGVQFQLSVFKLELVLYLLISFSCVIVLWQIVANDTWSWGFKCRISFVNQREWASLWITDTPLL